MLRNVRELIGRSLEATDGEIGTVQLFYFDDRSWTVRYLVVETGGWLMSRSVLISPAAFVHPDLNMTSFSVNLTRAQVASSPPIDTEKPITRQHEIDLVRYYGWPMYWIVVAGFPPASASVAGRVRPPVTEKDVAAAALHSTRDVFGDALIARDGETGTVEDFIIDDASWEIRYLVAEVDTFEPQKRILLPSPAVETVNGGTAEVHTVQSRRRIEAAPAYDPSLPLTRACENEVYDHYGLSPYWRKS